MEALSDLVFEKRAKMAAPSQDYSDAMNAGDSALDLEYNPSLLSEAGIDLMTFSDIHTLHLPRFIQSGPADYLPVGAFGVQNGKLVRGDWFPEYQNQQSWDQTEPQWGFDINHLGVSRASFSASNSGSSGKDGGGETSGSGSGSNSAGPRPNESPPNSSIIFASKLHNDIQSSLSNPTEFQPFQEQPASPFHYAQHNPEPSSLSADQTSPPLLSTPSQSSNSLLHALGPQPDVTSKVFRNPLDATASSLGLLAFQPPNGTPVQPPSFPLTLPSPNGLPVYSASGFDLLGILARVAFRSMPKVSLGPVDLSCAFTIVDVRRYDDPIVYASQSFCNLTGYDEAEILGRNCRFLQAPPNVSLKRGDPRYHTTADQVEYMRKHLSQNKEVQVTLVNYRKSGETFINLVTVVPIQWDTDDVIYHVGFQVDLSQQPQTIAKNMRECSYTFNPPPATVIHHRPLPSTAPFSRSLSLDLKSILPYLFTGPPRSYLGPGQERADLNMAILQHSPDFIIVVSLKGSLLFVSPSVQRVLGYEASELSNKLITDYCYPSDCIPLIRELKESIPPHNPTNSPPSSPSSTTVDLLFRLRHKSGRFVWIQCVGRPDSDPGKNRKAVILSARQRDMSRLTWEAIESLGSRGKDVWAQLSADGLWLVASTNATDVLGVTRDAVVGRKMWSFVIDQVDGLKTALKDTLAALPGDEQPKQATCEMVFGTGRRLEVDVTFFPHSSTPLTRRPSSIICRLRVLADHDVLSPSSRTPSEPHLPSATKLDASLSPVHPRCGNIFAELETLEARDDTQPVPSWLYELQQLKISNRKMTEEIQELEKQLGGASLSYAVPPTTSPTLSLSKPVEATPTDSLRFVTFKDGGGAKIDKGKKRAREDEHSPYGQQL